jgi:hypothetical protein
MDSIFDVMRRLVTGPQLHEEEQKIAHGIIDKTEVLIGEVAQHIPGFGADPEPSEAAKETGEVAADGAKTGGE